VLCLQILVQIDLRLPARREIGLPECYGFVKARASAEVSGMVW
jgi:hypothetical protein